MTELSEATADMARTVAGTKPFGAKCDILQTRIKSAGRYDYAICLPVRNEACLLPATLEAIGAAMRNADGTGVLVAVCNDTQDRSAGIIATWAERMDVPHAVVEISLARSVRGAPHCRRFAFDLGAMLAPAGILMTSDADSIVPPGWIARAQSILSYASMACGPVSLSPGELAGLPPMVEQVGVAERAYGMAIAKLWRRLTGDVVVPFLNPASGANMAITAAAYGWCGGQPLPSVGEDKALYELCLRKGLPIAPVELDGVTTSSRVKGRAKGGCAAALLERSVDPDPWCDQFLVPPAVVHRRAQRWRSMPIDERRIGRFLAHCRIDPALIAQPMRYSEVLDALAKTGRTCLDEFRVAALS